MLLGTNNVEDVPKKDTHMTESMEEVVIRDISSLNELASQANPYSL